MHPDERKWAKDNATKYQQYLVDKTGEKITAEEAYQRLLSAGYAVVDDAATKGGKSDESAKQFIGATAPRGMFLATATERANPFMSGNTDGSFTPEQQARFGSSKPGEQASMAITKAMQYLGQPCTDCRNKVAAIDGAITSLLEARVLYQDDPGSVKLIDQQIDQLKAGITKDELARGMAGVISDKDKGIAGLLLGAPSRLVTGAATAELLERTAITQGTRRLEAEILSQSNSIQSSSVKTFDFLVKEKALAAELKILESKSKDAHFISRHGPETTLAQQEIRATTGMTPDNFQGKAMDASRWSSYQDMSEAIKKAQTVYNETRQTSVTVELGRTIGDGYLKGGLTYVQTSKAVVRFNARGLPYTAYPKLR